MALLVKNDGTAVVEEPKITAKAVTTADSGEKVSTPAVSTAKSAAQSVSKTTASQNATAGISFDTIQQGLSTPYEGKYDQQLADLYNQIVQRKPFEYSSEDDMLYQMYKQRYTDQGKTAMRDTMGQAAALTGGYGSSYGQAVGQQTYDEYLKGLNDLLPQLYDRAYQRYAQEGDRLTQQYGLLSDLDSRDYSRWQGEQSQLGTLYETLMDAAAVRGAAGDFGGYEPLFGADSVDRMEFLFNAQTLMPLWQSGYIDAEKYKMITGEYPVGYKKSSGGGGGSSRSTPSGSDVIRTQLSELAARGAISESDFETQWDNSLKW